MAQGLDVEPLDGGILHLCLDMQNLFAPNAPWSTPWMPRVLPVVTEIAGRFPERTVFTRFIPPDTPEAAPGKWRTYYEKWREVTRTDRSFASRTRTRTGALCAAGDCGRQVSLFCLRTDEPAPILGGAELPRTDRYGLGNGCLCAGDGIGRRGSRLPDDRRTRCRSSDTGHDALLTLYHTRYSIQIETVPAETVLRRWR